MGSDISVGNNIARIRKERKLTQEDLASFLGVTKASVSKWETGQSYPDIELLPRIATYFGMSIDELVGYEPQMSRQDIRATCEQLRKAFAEEPFEQAHGKCQELARDYYSCYPLLAQVAVLYLNHMNLAGEPEREKLAEEAIDLCHRIRRNSESSVDVKLAEAVEASFLLATGNPLAAIEALGEVPNVDMGLDLLLANAYNATGQVGEAEKTLQGSLVQSLTLSLNRLAQLAMLWTGNLGKLETAHERTIALIDAFDMEELYVNAVAIHLSFAMAYIMGGNASRALDCLEDYERAARKLSFPIELHGDEFFDKAEAWLEDINALGKDAPREETLIKKSLVDSVAANPMFAPIADEARFKRVVKSLEAIVR